MVYQQIHSSRTQICFMMKFPFDLLLLRMWVSKPCNIPLISTKNPCEFSNLLHRDFQLTWKTHRPKGVTYAHPHFFVAKKTPTCMTNSFGGCSVRQFESFSFINSLPKKWSALKPGTREKWFTINGLPRNRSCPSLSTALTANFGAGLQNQPTGTEAGCELRLANVFVVSSFSDMMTVIMMSKFFLVSEELNILKRTNSCKLMCYLRNNEWVVY